MLKVRGSIMLIAAPHCGQWAGGNFLSARPRAAKLHPHDEQEIGRENFMITLARIIALFRAN
jgi:hypothetical protein